MILCLLSHCLTLGDTLLKELYLSGGTTATADKLAAPGSGIEFPHVVYKKDCRFVVHS